MTNVPRTDVAWSNVVVTVVICCIWSRDHLFKVWSDACYRIHVVWRMTIAEIIFSVWFLLFLTCFKLLVVCIIIFFIFGFFVGFDGVKGSAALQEVSKRPQCRKDCIINYGFLLHKIWFSFDSFPLIGMPISLNICGEVSTSTSTCQIAENLRVLSASRITYFSWDTWMMEK